MSSNDLQAAFRRAMLDIAEITKEFDSSAETFRKKVESEGARALAKRLLEESQPKPALVRLWEMGKLDSSVEALVLQERFRDLFSDAEKRIALSRLEALKMANPVRELPSFVKPDSAKTLSELASTFTASMLLILEESKEWDRFVGKIMERVRDEGGQVIARQMLHSESAQLGLLMLWQAKRLDLSVEALILQKDFRPLFTEDEIKLSRIRLETLGYIPED